MADPLPPLREVIARHGLRARKGLGQNFLLDLNLTGRIARAAGPLEDVTVLEVGPGPGGLTRALLDHGADHVIAIDADARVEPILDEIAAAYPRRLTPVIGDALIYAPPADGKPIRIVANLPYNIATPLLVRWLSQEPWPSWFDRMVLMFQREVADRIVAEPSTKAYGRLSVLTQWRTEPRRLFDIDPRAFVPAPKVVSSVVEFTVRQSPLPCSRAALEAVTAKAFGQRRKMLRASLKGLGPSPEMLLDAAEIEPTLRAEDVTIDGFVRLANAYESAKATAI